MVKLLFPLRNPTELETFIWGRYFCKEMDVVGASFCADVPPAQIFAQVERPHLDGIEGGLFWRIAKVHRAPRQSGEGCNKKSADPKGSTLLTETGEVRLPDQSLV